MPRWVRAESLFWIVGLCCLGYGAFLAAQASAYRHSAALLDGQQAGLRPPDTPQTTPVQGKPQDQGQNDLIGRIDIPALHLTAPIAADYDPGSLRKGVGHIRGTAMPGGLGTVGLAGHRDSFFRPLRNVKRAMEIRLTDRTGTFRYGVDSTEIVTPERVDVLDAGAEPGLTLITCYPFDYVGSAPKRFIVHAHLISVVPEHILSW